MVFSCPFVPHLKTFSPLLSQSQTVPRTTRHLLPKKQGAKGAVALLQLDNDGSWHLLLYNACKSKSMQSHFATLWKRFAPDLVFPPMEEPNTKWKKNGIHAEMQLITVWDKTIVNQKRDYALSLWVSSSPCRWCDLFLRLYALDQELDHEPITVRSSQVYRNGKNKSLPGWVPNSYFTTASPQ